MYYRNPMSKRAIYSPIWGTVAALSIAAWFVCKAVEQPKSVAPQPGAIIDEETARAFLRRNMDPKEHIKIIDEPDDQWAKEGDNVNFSVSVKTPTWEDQRLTLSYQWHRGSQPLDGKTNSVCPITNVTVAQVGLYSCVISKGNQVVVSQPASLSVTPTNGFRLTGPFLVFGAPVASSGAPNTNCPGSYIGYVNYTKSVAQGWGWAPSTNSSHAATDTNQIRLTRVEYGGKFGDTGCNLRYVPVTPTNSTKYRFTIYFTNNLPTNPYPISLEGFVP